MASPVTDAVGRLTLAAMRTFLSPAQFGPRLQRAAVMTIALVAVGSSCFSGSSDDESATQPEQDQVELAETEEARAGESEPDETQAEESENEVAQAEEAQADQADADEAQPEEAQPAADSTLVGSLVANPGERTEWRATIDGDIEADVWLAQTGGFVRGEITYDSVGEPIMLIGQAYDSRDGYFVREFVPGEGRAEVTGTLILGQVEDGTVTEAAWNDDSLTLDYVGVADEPYFFDPLARAGDYTYAFAPFGEGDKCCGPSGRLTISDVEDTSLQIEMNTVTSGPAFNQAFVDPTVVPLKGNVARFEQLDEFTDCAFDITVFDGFAFVQHVDDRFDCGFGNRATPSGIFVLMP